jgi:hypothetical protein
MTYRGVDIWLEKIIRMCVRELFPAGRSVVIGNNNNDV